MGYFTKALEPEMSSVYASIADSNEVFTFSRDNFNRMNKELKDLRDPAVVPASVMQSTEFSLTTKASTLAATSKDGVWSLTAGPKPLPGDAAAISEYLRVIGELRAIKFVDGAGDLKALGLDPPQLTIDLKVPGQTQHEVLLVGKAEEGLEGGKITPVMRQGEKTVYQVQTSDAAKLATTPVALRDRNIERIDVDRIRKIEISGPLATAGVTATQPAASAPATGPATASAPAPLSPGVVLEREGTKWVVKKGGETKTADDAKISGFLADFTPLQASKYVDDKPAEGTPSIVVTLTLLDAPAPPAAPATAPAAATATAPATGTAPATATAPAAPIVAPVSPMGPDMGKTVTCTLRLYRQENTATASAPATAPATAPASTWKAVWDKQSPAWTFEPNSFLTEHVSKEIYTADGNAGLMLPGNP